MEDLYLLDSCKKRNGPGVMVVSPMILGFGGKDFQVFLRLNPVQQLLGEDLWTFRVVGGVSLSVDKVSIWVPSFSHFVVVLLQLLSIVTVWTVLAMSRKMACHSNADVGWWWRDGDDGVHVEWWWWWGVMVMIRRRRKTRYLEYVIMTWWR